MKKITLAVLFGGSSTEYEISLQSAHAVLTHLDRDRYEPVLLGITRDGRWSVPALHGWICFSRRTGALSLTR